MPLATQVAGEVDGSDRQSALALTWGNGVEVAQALSNPLNRASALIAEWDVRPARFGDVPLTPGSRYRPLRVQNRLAPKAAAELVAMYQVGATVGELARLLAHGHPAQRLPLGITRNTLSPGRTYVCPVTSDSMRRLCW